MNWTNLKKKFPRKADFPIELRNKQVSVKPIIWKDPWYFKHYYGSWTPSYFEWRPLDTSKSEVKG